MINYITLEIHSENFSNRPSLTSTADFGIFLNCHQSRFKNRCYLCALFSASVCLTHSSSSLYVQTQRCSFPSSHCKKKKNITVSESVFEGGSFKLKKAPGVTRAIKKRKNQPNETAASALILLWFISPIQETETLLSVLLMAMTPTPTMMVMGMMMPLVKLSDAATCLAVRRLLLQLSHSASRRANKIIMRWKEMEPNERPSNENRKRMNVFGNWNHSSRSPRFTDTHCLAVLLYCPYVCQMTNCCQNFSKLSCSW